MLPNVEGNERQSAETRGDYGNMKVYEGRREG